MIELYFPKEEIPCDDINYAMIKVPFIFSINISSDHNKSSGISEPYSVSFSIFSQTNSFDQKYAIEWCKYVNWEEKTSLYVENYMKNKVLSEEDIELLKKESILIILSIQVVLRKKIEIPEKSAGIILQSGIIVKKYTIKGNYAVIFMSYDGERAREIYIPLRDVIII